MRVGFNMADVSPRGGRDLQQDDNRHSRHGKNKHDKKRHKHKKKSSKRDRSPEHDKHSHKRHRDSVNTPAQVVDNAGSSGHSSGGGNTGMLNAFVFDSSTMPTGDDLSHGGSDSGNEEPSETTGANTCSDHTGQGPPMSSMMGFSGGQKVVHHRPAPGPTINTDTSEMLNMMKDIRKI